MIVGYTLEWKLSERDGHRERERAPDGKNIWSAAPEDNSQRGAVIKIKQNRKPRW